MNMKKILRMCLALLLCLLTLCPALGEAEFTRDEAREIVEALLAAAAGTTFDDEQRLRHLFDDTFELRNTADQETLYANFNAFAAAVSIVTELVQSLI